MNLANNRVCLELKLFFQSTLELINEFKCFSFGDVIVINEIFNPILNKVTLALITEMRHRVNQHYTSLLDLWC